MSSISVDSRSTIFLHELEEVASNITDLQKDPHGHPLARVNCYDWTDVCQKENITTYPTLRVYRNGQRQDYNDVLDKDVVIRMIRLWVLHALSNHSYKWPSPFCPLLNFSVLFISFFLFSPCLNHFWMWKMWNLEIKKVNWRNYF